MSEAFVSAPVNEAIRRAVEPWLPPWNHYTSIIEVTAPAGNAVFEVAHRLGAVPDGVLVVMEFGGFTRSVDPHRWTSELAYVVSDRAAARARLIFFTARHPVTRAQGDLFPGAVPPPEPGGGGEVTGDESFVTVNAEPTLPNHRKLVAGTNVTLDKATPGWLIINAAGGGAGGMNLDYLGDYAPGPVYNDGDIVIGADGVAYMCVVDGTTTPPEPWPGVGVAVNATVDAKYWVVSAHAALTNERVMSALANGYVKSTAGEPSTVAIIPVVDGGTGASTPALARTNLGVGSVGTLNLNGNAATYLNGAGAWTTPPAPPAAAPVDATYWVVAAHAGLSNERALAALATGYVKSTAGEPSTVAIIPITDGGTGASTAPTARTNLGVGTVGPLNLNGDAATYLNGAGSWTTPQGVPTGAIILFTGACPPGYSRVAGWDGYYVRFGAAYGSGGATSHSHGTGTLAAPAHTHTDGTYAAANHSHASGTLVVASHTHGSVSISGNTSSDGGHAHSVEITSGVESTGQMNVDGGNSGNMARGNHTHTIAGTSGTTPSHNHSFSGSGATGSASPDVAGDTAAENADVTGVSGPASATALTGALATAANDPLYVQLVACQKD